jgi:peptidoglycan/LPS O-acetylase OafA/YrhL
MTRSKAPGPTSRLEVVTVPSPTVVRQAAVLVAVEGAAGLVAAVVYVASGFGGADEPGLNKFGTAGWFAIIGGAVLAAGWALWTGRRWGRGIAVFAQLLLLPVAYYVAVGSHQWAYGIPIAVFAIGTLGLLFSRSAVEWVAAQDSSASADNSGPDTR